MQPIQSDLGPVSTDSDPVSFCTPLAITRYIVRLVARCFHQREGIDYTETYSPVIQPATIRVVLTLAITNGWKCFYTRSTS